MQKTRKCETLGTCDLLRAQNLNTDDDTEEIVRGETAEVDD